MRKLYNPKFKCITYELFGGEFFATAEHNVVLTTLLGSCVAVCLMDNVNEVVGMNHFMLPGKFHFDKLIPVKDGKYGAFAIEMLIMEMLKEGAKRQNLKAKVFGAGKVVEHFTRDIAGSNEDFIKQCLSEINIPIIAQDLGGNYGRKLYFFSKTKEVLVRRITDVNLIPAEEKYAVE